MLDCQMWCWGRDIRCPAGNLLIELGYRRRPSPGAGSTEYAAWDDAHLLRLWGFGVMIVPSAGSAVALQRNLPDPLVLEGRVARERFDRGRLTDAGRPAGASDRSLLADLLPRFARHVADYEGRVVSLRGDAWRRQVQAGWARGSGTVVDAPARWWRVARLLEACLAEPSRRGVGCRNRDMERCERG